MYCRIYTHQYLTPPAPHARYPIDAFNRCPTSCTTTSTVSLHPVMSYSSASTSLTCTPDSGMRLYAIRRSPLYATLMHSVLAEYATQSLFTQTDKFAQAKVTIGRPVEVLQAPSVLSISGNTRIKSKQNQQWNSC